MGIFTKVKNKIKSLPVKQTASVVSSLKSTPVKTGLSAPKPLPSSGIAGYTSYSQVKGAANKAGVSNNQTLVPKANQTKIPPMSIAPKTTSVGGYTSFNQINIPSKGGGSGGGRTNANTTSTQISPLSANRTAGASQGSPTGTNNIVAGAGGVTGGLTNIVNAGTDLNAGINKLTIPEPTVTEAPITTPIAPVVPPETTARDTAMQDYIDSLTKEAPSSADAYNKAYRESKLAETQQIVGDLTGQLNAVVAKGQANQLAQVGQGRGIPEAIIGGIQAQIGRETAIAALPLQAQLSAAQGNMEMAQQHLDTLFKIYSDDAKNEYEHKLAQKKMVYDIATEKEKRMLDKQAIVEERQYKETQDLHDEQSTYAKMAFANGQSSLGSKIAKLDYKSPTFKEDLANLQSQLKDPVQTAQLQKLSAEIAKLNAESQLASNGGANEDLIAYASQYSDTGKLPSPAELKLSGLSVGQVTTMAKQIPRADGFVVSNVTGTKSNSISAEAEKDFQKLYNITKMTERLKELDKKRVGGLVSGVLGSVFGSEDQGEYLTLRKAIVDEMSRMQSGAALTPEEIAVYNDYLPGRTSEAFFLGRDSYKKIGSFETAMNQKLSNRLVNNGLSIYGYSKVKVPGDKEPFRTVGEIIDIKGVNYRVLPDGTLTDIL